MTLYAKTAKWCVGECYGLTVDGRGPPPKGRRVAALYSIRSAAENHAAPIRLQSDYVIHVLASHLNVASQLKTLGLS